MEMCLEQAKGDYITFVDADDRMRPGMLRRLYEMLQETNSDMAGCRFVVWGTEGEWEQLAGTEASQERTEPMSEMTYYDSGSYLKESLLRGNTRCWSKLYKRRQIFRSAI